MAAKKQNQQSQDSESQKSGAPQQQELGQGDQQQENQGQAPEAKPDNASGPAEQGGEASGSNPDPAPTPDPGDDGDQDSDTEQEVFVLVDHNPLGLKCATVATMPASQAARLEKQGIVDTAEAAVSRGKANQPGGTGGDQVIEDDD